MQMFTGSGEFLTTWGGEGNGEGEFNLPYAIRPGADGIVYVSDSSNFRVQQFLVTVPEPSRGLMLASSLACLSALATRRRRTRTLSGPAGSGGAISRSLTGIAGYHASPAADNVRHAC